MAQKFKEKILGSERKFTWAAWKDNHDGENIPGRCYDYAALKYADVNFSDIFKNKFPKTNDIRITE